MRRYVQEFVPGLLAGLIAGIAGSWLMGYLMATQGLRVPILPGALAGLACGQTSAFYSRRRGVINALFVLGVVVYAQWKLFDPPFDFDGSLTQYVLHLHQLPPLTLILFAVNVVLGYWWGREQGIGFGRIQRQPTAAEPVDRDLV